MAEILDLLGGKFLSAENVQQPLLVTIAGAERIEMDGQARLTLQFAELQKPLLANKTNLTTVARLFGTDTTQWVGQQVVLQVEPVQFQGKTVNGLRVKPYQQPAQPVRLSPATAPVVRHPGQFAAQPARTMTPPPAPGSPQSVASAPQQVAAIVPPDAREQPPVDEIPF